MFYNTATFLLKKSLNFCRFVKSGVGAELNGGNFWQGAVTGGIIAGLNHAMHSMDGLYDNGYDENGKKVNNNGGDKTDYLYDKDGNVISSTSVKVTFSQGGEVNSTFEGYGFRHYTIGTGGALYDPSWDMFQFYAGGAEIKAGFGVFKMGITKVLKSDVGIRTVLGASPYALKSSVFFERMLGSRSINIFGIKSLPSLYGKALTWGTFLGRNTPIIGTAIMYDGVQRIYNTFKNFGK